MVYSATHDNVTRPLPSEGVDLAHALQRETDGNPYYVSELLRHLFYSGAFRLGPDGRWSLEADLADLGLPGSIRDVVATRIDRLGEDAAHNLAIAAVIGREFDLGVLAEVCELDEERLLDLMDSAITAAVVREGEPGRFQFVHALIPHTLYQGLSATRRQRIHRRVAEALEGMDREVRPRATELARHWLAATRPADVSQAVRYARQAAEEALAALAPQDAIGWFEQALELLVGQPANQSFQRSRASLLVGLGNAQRQAGTGDYRATLREAADLSRQIGENDLLVAAALAGARGSHVTAVADHETLALLSAALEAVGPADSPERARLLVALADALEPHEWRRAQELALEALEVAGRLDQDEARLAVLVGAMGPLAHPSFAEQRRIYSTVAVDLADRLGHPLWRSLARFYRMYTRVETADLEGTDRDLNEMTDIAERTTLPLLVWQLRLSTAWRHLLAGRLEHAEADIEEAFALGSASGQPEAVGCYAGQMFNLRRHQGRIGEVAEFFLDAAEAMPAMPALRAASCFLHCELGRPDVARVAFEQDRETGFSLYPHDLTWSVAMVELAHVATELGDRHGARLLYGLLEPYSGSVTFNMGVDLGPVDRSLGRLAGTLGRLDAAEAYFRQALSTLERFTAPYWEATTLLDYADLLERTGQPAVRPRRDRALLLAERFGFIGLEDRARSGL